jgi:ribonuclease E
MTVVDVNTGKFTGSGGNLEETVTKNNLEAAEEMVRQLRLRDIGGIIVIDFIDMVLESNRDLVLRRLIECLGRDRTRHQVAEVTSLGLVQMTRKRIGTGLLEAFSENCDHCQGRGLIIHQEPVEQRRKQVDEEPRRNRRSRGRGKGDEQSSDSGPAAKPSEVRRPTPAEFAAMARAEHDHPESDSHAEPSEALETPEASEVSVAPPAAPEPVNDTPADEPADTPVDDTPPVAPPVTPPPPPAAPRIVTSVRRVGARRPAGPPAGQTTTAVLERSNDLSAPGAGTSSAVPEESVDPIAPSVHDDDDSAGSVGQPHVPVKKRGARKR